MAGEQRVLTVMMSDVVDSTRLRTRVGDEAATALNDQIEALTRAAIAAQGGWEVKSLGDGFLAAFEAPRAAIRCAVDLQRSLTAVDELPLVRIGITTGEVTVVDDDLAGETVAAASRIESKAQGGQVLVSDLTVRLAGTMTDVEFDEIGSFELKGFDGAWTLVAALPAEAAAPEPVSAPTAPEPVGEEPQLVHAVIGVGGSGVTHRIQQLVDDLDRQIKRYTVTPGPGEDYAALRAIVAPEVPTGDDHQIAALMRRVVGSAVLVVDDGHLADGASLRSLAAYVQQGGSLVFGARPAASAEFGALLDAAVSVGSRTGLSALPVETLGEILASVSGRAVDSEMLDSLHRVSGGLPGLALAAFDGVEVDLEHTELAERGERELRRMSGEAAEVARVVAVADDLPDAIVGAAAGIADDRLAIVHDELRSAGFVTDDVAELLPAARAAVRSTLVAADRRRLHEVLAQALLDRGGESIQAAEHLLSAGATGPRAADVFARAGEELRFRRPDEALDWFQAAISAGADARSLVAGTAEANAVAGYPSESATPVADDAVDRSRLLAVRAAEAARDGRLSRSVELYGQLDEHPILTDDARRIVVAAGALGVGRLDVAHPASAPVSDPLDTRASALALIASACMTYASDPAGSAAVFVEAAEALERLDLDMVLPDSAHALGALCLSLAGDLPAAESLLGRAVQGQPAGPGFDVRHRLLTAWMHLRTARYELPSTEVTAMGELTLAGRDELMVSALQAGMARRSGDVPRMRQAWGSAEATLLRGVSDAFHIEPVSELVLAGIRLGHRDRVQPILSGLREAITALGDTNAWLIPTRWLDMQIAVESDDPGAASTALAALEDAKPLTEAQHAMVEGSRRWADVLGGTVAVDAVIDAADRLAAAHLPWEASRLAGQAAVRTTNQAVAKRLLERARSHHHTPEAPGSDAAADVGLSGREVDVARYVVDGLTHREIGEQLYISPKTVEHHVARIRRKLGVTTRADMLAALNELLASLAESE